MKINLLPDVSSSVNILYHTSNVDLRVCDGVEDIIFCYCHFVAISKPLNLL